MKKILLIVFLAVLLISDANSQKTKKKRIRHEKKKEIPPTVEVETVESQQSQLEQQAHARDVLEAKLKAIEASESEAVPADENIPDPCENKRCGPGRECVPGLDGKARCACMKACPTEADFRRRVCSNYNETWESDCELYRSRCLCLEEQEECKNHLNKHLHIEYYGECRQMPACTEEEMSDFPRRMRDWLFNVMRELADRKELSTHYLQMEREAERSTNDSQRSVTAAIWKWCDLDGHPHDKQVSRHELFPIRAPLMALEHCIAPFLDSCDADNDHRITLSEWGTCLEVPMHELDNKCDDVRDGVDEELEAEEAL
jgi:hypothetical protein